MRPILPAAAIAVLAACATVPTQTKFMEEQGVKVTSEALRTRLRAEAIPFTGRMGEAADVVRESSADPAVRRRTLVWKINVVPALYRTLFNQRPLVALLDTWALLLQAEGYLASPEGREAFGPGVDRMLATTRELEERVREIAAWAAPGRDLVKVRAALQAWAEKHPVHLTFGTRENVENYLASVSPGEELGAFALAGRMGEDLEGIIDRMDFLPVMVPLQATWQAELVYLDLLDPRMQVALEKGGEALERVDDMLQWLGTKGLDRFANEQRVQLMLAVGSERAEVERLVERQRLAIEEFVERERVAVAALIAEERAATLADARRLVDHATAEASRSAMEVVDRAFLRLAVLVGVALAVLLGIALLARRRSAPGGPPRA
ncbi:MAG: hypothetical protein WB493_17230 [Anaeromyxobacteraceae bacterium]